MKNTTLSLATTLCLACLPALHAEPLAYEGFNMSETSGSGTEGGWSEVEQTAFTNNVALRPEGLGFGNLPAIGGSAQSLYFANSLNFKSPIKLADGPVFVSFLVRGNERAKQYSENFEAQGGVVDQAGNKILAGFGWGKEEPYQLATNMKVEGFPGVYNMANITMDKTILVVIKLTAEGGDAKVETWFYTDPESMPSEEGTGDVRATGVYKAPGTTELTAFHLHNYGMDATFDELRIGRTFSAILGK